MIASPAAQEKQILLVEDSMSDIRLTSRALENLKFKAKIHSVRSGADAMAFLNKFIPFDWAPDPDLIILDLNLPGIDGREVLTYLRHERKKLNTPVIVVSTSMAQTDIQFCMDLNVTKYIIKPHLFGGFAELIQEVEKVFGFENAEQSPRND